MKLTHFFTVLNQIKTFHWQTRSYAQHKTLDKAYDSLNDLFDEFVEVYLGRYGRDDTKKEYVVKFQSYDFASGAELRVKLSDLFDGALSIINEMVGEGNSDLQNIRDSIKGEFHRILYLLSLE
ncbi:hypothetical protein EBU95_21085 [bacterium]|nr:hypothetical protein [bacterium]